MVLPKQQHLHEASAAPFAAARCRRAGWLRVRIAAFAERTRAATRVPPPRSALYQEVPAPAAPQGSKRRAFCRRAPPPRRLAPGSNRPSRSERGDTSARRARVRLRQDETRREEKEMWMLMFLLPRPRRELASVLAPRCGLYLLDFRSSPDRPWHTSLNSTAAAASAPVSPSFCGES